MARITIPDGDGEELYRLWSMAPALTGPAAALSGAVYQDSRMPIRLRELMRMRIARINDCGI